MKFAIKSWSKGRARAGILQIVGSSSSCPYPTEIEIETPALLLSTRKGLPFFISPDLLASLPSPDSRLLQFSPLHFLEGITPQTISTIGGLHEMLGLLEFGFAAVPRDSISCLPDYDGTNKIGASFETPCGRVLIKPSEYMKIISCLKPNSWTTLADEVPAWVSEKRNKTSVDRTVRWLDDCMTLSSKDGNTFGAIVGGSSVEERQRCAQEVAKRNVSERSVTICSIVSLPYFLAGLQKAEKALSSLEGITPQTISTIGGLHEMLGLLEFGFAAVPRDSISCLPDYDGTNKIGASFETPCGRVLIKPSEYMKIISCLKPNSWTTLADEVPAWVSEKRNKTSVDRTVRWLDDCMTLSSKDGNTFGAIVGGSSVEERQRCAQEVAKRNVSGYWIGGFGLGESMEDRSPLLNAVTDSLPEQKPRQICGLGLPEEVLQGIDSGVDLFDATYIYHLTTGGFALTCPLERTVCNVHDSQLSNMGSDGTKINLKATVYRKDNSPIIDGCRCYTCQNHTKAYINHLLNAHEMLAQILLEIHNTHHYLRFFRAIREAIKGGKFEEYHQQFIENRHDHMFAASFSA